MYKTQNPLSLKAIGYFLEKTTKPPSEGCGYCCLHTFSRTSTIPVIEEQFDQWMAKAWLMVKESNSSWLMTGIARFIADSCT